MRASCRAAWLVVPCLFAARVAHAETTVPDTALTLRLDVPGVSVAGSDGWIQLIGAAAGMRFHRWIETELAADFAANPCESGVALSARGGVTPSIIEPGSTGRWNLRTPVLAGATAMLLSGGGCDQSPDERLFAITGASGLEAIRWGSRHGLELRALVFAGTQSYESMRTTDPQRDWRPVYGVTFSIGIALPL